MKRVVALQYASGRLLGVTFAQERRGRQFVGVAVVTDEVAKKFEGRPTDFEVEDVSAAEVASDFPPDFPLLGPQKAALLLAGLDSLTKVRAHDFTREPVKGIGPATVKTLADYLNPPVLLNAAKSPAAAKKGDKVAVEDKPKSEDKKPEADPPPT